MNMAPLVIFLLLGINYNHEWFSRGGSIIVMFSVASEFGLVKIHSDKTNELLKGIGGVSGGVIDDLNILSPYPELRFISHGFVVVGTVVWGFGDWFLSWAMCYV